MSDLGTRTGKPIIESDRVEGTTVYDREGNDIGSIKRLMIEKLSGQTGLCGDVIRRISRHGVGRAYDSMAKAEL
jgi:hypothetical protein